VSHGEIERKLEAGALRHLPDKERESEGGAEKFDRAGFNLSSKRANIGVSVEKKELFSLFRAERNMIK